MSEGIDRYQERLAALERMSERLSVAGVGHIVYHNRQNCAPSPGDHDMMPVLDVAGGWAQVKVLYWDGLPKYSYPYLSSPAQPVDDEGLDRVASRVVRDYLDARAHGELDERRM